MKTCHLTAATLVALASLAHAETKPAVQANYGKLPLSFEANQGQVDPQVKFTSHGQGYSLFLTDSAAVLTLTKSDASTTPDSPTKLGAPFKPAVGLSGNQPIPTKIDIIRMELAGAAPNLQVTGADQLPGKSNYFIGNDPSKWHSNIPTYAKVRYNSVYPGVDLVYYGNQRQLEYDFILAPNADPKPVKLHFAGADKLNLNAEGDLEITAKEGQIAFHKPVIYQRVSKSADLPGNGAADGREPVSGKFVLLADKTVGFKLGSYDHSRELVIDPVLAYSTYLGGGRGEVFAALAVDDLGDSYVTGQTFSADFPVTPGAYKTSDPLGPVSRDFIGFITKIAPAGTRLVYSTYFGGEPYAIAVDSTYSAYVTGGARGGAFVTKLNPAGSALAYYRVLGLYSGRAIAVDSTGHAYVAGVAGTGFPVTSGAFETTIGPYSQAAFVTKLDPTGSTLEYSTFLGPHGYSGASGIAIDSEGHAYVAGATDSPLFPTTSSAFQPRYPGSLRNDLGSDVGFVTKLTPDGSAVEYSTFLGGTGANPGKGDDPGDGVAGIAIDASGNAYVVGSAAGFFPTTPGAFQPVHYVPTGTATGFVTKLNPQGSGLVYSTLFGDYDHSTYPAGIGVDPGGDAWITGETDSLDLPTTANALQSSAGGGRYSPFLTELKPDGTGLIYSTYFGGDGAYGDAAHSIALDRLGNVYIAGIAASDDFPVTPGAFQRRKHPPAPFYFVFNSFIAKFAVSGITATNLTSDANPQQIGTAVAFTATVASTEGSGTPTGAVSFLIDGGFIPHVDLDDTGRATYSTSSLSPGQHSVVVTYLGDPTYSTSFTTLIQTITGGRVAAPSFWPLSSTSHSARTVTISTATTGATIHYTTDGSKPTRASTPYTGPIEVSSTSTIQAIAVQSGNTQSAVASASYTIVKSTAITSTSVTSSLNPSSVGTPVTFTATVTPASGPTPTGSVTFVHTNVVMGIVPLVNGVATFTTSALGVNYGLGYGIIAVYTGSATNSESVSPTLAQKVNP